MPFFAFNFSIFFNFLSPKMLITCSSSTFFLVTLLYRVFIFLPACELRSRKGIMIKLSCNACEHRSMSLECKQVAYSTEDYNKRVHKQWCILSFDYWAFSSLWLKDFFLHQRYVFYISFIEYFFYKFIQLLFGEFLFLESVISHSNVSWA